MPFKERKITKMSKEKINVVMVANNLELNGISTVIINYCSNIDLKKYDITIMVGETIALKYKEICMKKQIKLIELPNRKKCTLQFYNALNKELKIKKYDIFHIHGNSAMVVPELLLAKANHINVRIMHCHNSTCNNLTLNKLLHPILEKIITGRVACSKKAGEWIFNKNEFMILPNAFKVEAFQYSIKQRERIRKDLDIADDCCLIGHVGRFNDQKNQKFILKIFDELLKKKSNFKLLLVGNGPNYSSIVDSINKSKNKDNIIIYGESSDTSALYSAMDIFVCPSLYEGLGIVVVEAQISGLPVIASEAFPNDTKITDLIKYKSLLLNEKEWADEILQIYEQQRIDRKIQYSNNKNMYKNFEITECVHLLEKFYREQVKICGKGE